MSGKLDQSLDSILAARKKTNRPRRNLRKPAGAKPVAAPVGGVKKPTRPAKKSERPSGPANTARGEGKVMISNLVS
jgi:THO complex subunit 4